jgi:hypothetical protein
MFQKAEQFFGLKKVKFFVPDPGSGAFLNLDLGRSGNNIPYTVRNAVFVTYHIHAYYFRSATLAGSSCTVFFFLKRRLSCQKAAGKRLRKADGESWWNPFPSTDSAARTWERTCQGKSSISLCRSLLVSH